MSTNKIFMTVLLISVFAIPVLADTNGRKSSNPSLSQLREEQSQKPGWKTLINNTYAFRIALPTNSWIDNHRDGGQSEYIRVQNYRHVDDRSTLSSGEYWLEIHIFDHKKNRKVWEPCSAAIVKPTITEQKGTKIYRGEPIDISPDSGGYMQALCTETTEFDVYIHASENDVSTPLLRAILTSFQLNH